MKLFNTLFETRVARLLFNKVHYEVNWDNFISSLLPYEPDWENEEHLIITPHSIRLEVIGVSLRAINTDLRIVIEEYKQMLMAYRTNQDQDCDLLDAMMIFCLSFYENHPSLSIEYLKELSRRQFSHFSKIHEFGKPLHKLMIEDWIEAFNHPSGHKELCKNLAWDAVGRFIDICRFEFDIEARKKTSQKLDLSMLKGWAKLLINAQHNFSAYRFVSRIFERDISSSAINSPPTKSLSLLNDAGDCDVVHSFSSSSPIAFFLVFLLSFFPICFLQLLF